jgi:hypothetical protein
MWPPSFALPLIFNSTRFVSADNDSGIVPPARSLSVTWSSVRHVILLNSSGRLPVMPVPSTTSSSRQPASVISLGIAPVNVLPSSSFSVLRLLNPPNPGEPIWLPLLLPAMGKLSFQTSEIFVTVVDAGDVT